MVYQTVTYNVLHEYQYWESLAASQHRLGKWVDTAYALWLQDTMIDSG